MGLKLWQAVGTLPDLFRDPYDLPRVVELYDALSSWRPIEALYALMVRGVDADTRAELAALTRQPVDVHALAALPAGTLGRAYVDFLAHHGLTHDYYLQAYPPSRATVEANWVMHRFAKTHDFHHVLLGASAELPDEIGLQVFNVLNFGEPFGAASVVALPFVMFRYGERRRTLRAVLRLGRAARRLDNAFLFPWERHYATPVTALRERFRVPANGLL